MAPFPATTTEATTTLQALAAGLVDPSRRDEARRELEALVLLADGRPEGAALRLQELDFAVGARRERLRLLLLPSMDAVGIADHAFLEGLLRLGPDAYEGKRLVDVDAGPGWIAIALARLTALRSIEGLSAAPEAAAAATCNLWLNCDAETAARVSFGAGDRLRDPPPEARWDFIAGRLPQTLCGRAEEAPCAPPVDDPRVDEARFGLGRMAALLDEAPERLNPGGRLLLQLSARPGRAILERVFDRLGYAAEVLAAKRVVEADTQEIGAAAALERATGVDFTFFLSERSAEPIGAEAGLRWREAGHPLWHEVAVWEARLRHPQQMRALRRVLYTAGLGRILKRAAPGAASRPRLAAAASLATRLAARPALPYALAAGELGLRETIVRDLARSSGLTLSEQELFVAPARPQALYALLLATCDPGDEVLATPRLHRDLARAFDKAGVRVTRANENLREVRRLLSAFDPKAVFVEIADAGAEVDALLALVDDAAARGIWVVAVERPRPASGCELEPRALLERLAEERHRPNLVSLIGTPRSAVFPDDELTLLFPVPERLFADLEVAASLTYGRISTPLSWLHEQRLEARAPLSFSASGGVGRRAFPERPLPRSRRMEEAARAEAFAPQVFASDDPRLIRLDAGENVDRIPHALLEGLLSAALQPPSEGAGLEAAAAAFLSETRGVEVAAGSIVCAQGVRPLIHDAALGLGRLLERAPRIFVAAPCDGVLPPTLRAAGAAVTTGPLTELLERDGAPPDAVFISQPASPEGCFLSEATLRALCDYALRKGARIFSDERAGLLALQRPKATSIPSPLGVEPRLAARILLFDGLSAAFAAGGLRVGFACVPDPALRAALRDARLAPLPRAAEGAAAHLYEAWRRTPGGELLHPKRRAALEAYLESLRRGLVAKRELLAGAFGAAVRPCDAGGLSLAPDLSGWFGKVYEGERLTPENLPRILYRHTGVVVSGGPSCADPRRVRAVFALPRERVEEAARRIAAFARRLEG